MVTSRGPSKAGFPILEIAERIDSLLPMHEARAVSPGRAMSLISNAVIAQTGFAQRKVEDGIPIEIGG